MSLLGKKGLRCSFCGKDDDHVQFLLAGPKVFICGECVDKCVEIIDRTKASGTAPA
ncbi:MAG TPA: ClpX C4-type zinc finger protein [Candidatus Binataceae bacterium]|nr:ClpX C4-type zinc finger protein [Candidatus Binataceae bacterium]